MRVNQGNILRVMHVTDCNLEQAIEALKKTDSWQDAFKYAKQLMGE